MTKRKKPSLAERVLLALGVLLLAFYAAATLHGSFFQAYDSWAFDRARAGDLHERSRCKGSRHHRAGDDRAQGNDNPECCEPEFRTMHTNTPLC